MFRRLIRRDIRRMTANAVTQNEFFRANQLYTIGQFEAAASAYTQLAHQMERIGKPRQAANLHARGALAWAKAGIEQRALNQANIALGQYTLLGMRQRLSEFKIELDQVLYPHKVPVDSDQAILLNNESITSVSQTVTNTRHVQLPAICPQCGAPVRTDEIAWIDETSAECDFCGAILQEE